MKFRIGDATDTKLCVALKHEFLRCDDAFNDFFELSAGQGESPRSAYKTYNAYARFVQHLYEFMLGAVARERLDTKRLEYSLADRYIAGHAQRILTNRRQAILAGTAPSWENHVSYYPERVPERFAEDFRNARNIASVHVTSKRADLSLSSFFHQNHKYLHMLYYDAKSWWGRQGEAFPDLKEVTAFSLLVKAEPPPS
jgi:hypothetical protein